MAVFIIPSSAIAECMISEGKLGEFKTLTVENDKVRFKIVPQVGGRIVEYTLKSSGHNQLFSDDEAFTSYKPGETMTRTVMYRAGGHEDTIKVTRDDQDQRNTPRSY